MAQTIQARQGPTIPSQARLETSLPLHPSPRLIPTPPTTPTLTPTRPTLPNPCPISPRTHPTLLALKNTYWPAVFCPRRKWEPEPWTTAQVRWAFDAVHCLKQAYATIAQNQDEVTLLVRRVSTHAHCAQLPIVAHVPIPHGDDTQLSCPFFTYDARTSTHHPLRHAALDVIRQVADARAQRLPVAQNEATKNGAQYLLTGLTLFITHEPCLMCTMALLHSRIKAVFYLVPHAQDGWMRRHRMHTLSQGRQPQV